MHRLRLLETEISNGAIEPCLQARDVEDLYDHVLVRVEAAHGRRIVREALSLMAASRNGLSEEEMAAMIPRAGALPAILRALGNHCSRRDGLYRPVPELRRAIERRYLMAEGSWYARTRLVIADYFAGTALTHRRAEEEPWQLLQAGLRDRLKACITDIPMFLMMRRGPRRADLPRYWAMLRNDYDIVREYGDAIEREAVSGADAVEIRAELARFLAEIGGRRPLRSAMVDTISYHDNGPAHSARAVPNRDITWFARRAPAGYPPIATAIP